MTKLLRQNGRPLCRAHSWSVRQNLHHDTLQTAKFTVVCTPRLTHSFEASTGLRMFGIIMQNSASLPRLSRTPARWLYYKPSSSHTLWALRLTTSLYPAPPYKTRPLLIELLAGKKLSLLRAKHWHWGNRCCAGDLGYAETRGWPAPGTSWLWRWICNGAGESQPQHRWLAYAELTAYRSNQGANRWVLTPTTGVISALF